MNQRYRTERLFDKEPHIANCVLQCLRTWKERRKPAPLIIADEDIDQLIEYAKECSKNLDWLKGMYKDNGIPFRISPEQITGRRR